MASWQNDPAAFQGKSGLAYLVAMNENCSHNPPLPTDLDTWQQELKFQAVMLTDPVRTVYTVYAQANGCANSPPGGTGCSNAVTVVVDKHMKIRHFGPTYLCGVGSGNSCGKPGVISNPTCENQLRDLILQLLAEP